MMPNCKLISKKAERVIELLSLIEERGFSQKWPLECFNPTTGRFSKKSHFSNESANRAVQALADYIVVELKLDYDVALNRHQKGWNLTLMFATIIKRSAWSEIVDDNAFIDAFFVTGIKKISKCDDEIDPNWCMDCTKFAQCEVSGADKPT
jgi:hypothetical protein